MLKAKVREAAGNREKKFRHTRKDGDVLDVWVSKWGEVLLQIGINRSGLRDSWSLEWNGIRLKPSTVKRLLKVLKP